MSTKLQPKISYTADIRFPWQTCQRNNTYGYFFTDFSPANQEHKSFFHPSNGFGWQDLVSLAMGGERR
jgi:hypothetical protein